MSNSFNVNKKYLLPLFNIEALQIANQYFFNEIIFFYMRSSKFIVAFELMLKCRYHILLNHNKRLLN